MSAREYDGGNARLQATLRVADLPFLGENTLHKLPCSHGQLFLNWPLSCSLCMGSERDKALAFEVGKGKFN